MDNYPASIYVYDVKPVALLWRTTNDPVLRKLCKRHRFISRSTKLVAQRDDAQDDEKIEAILCNITLFLV